MYNHQMPAVSILMPVFNAQATLESALESLTRQSMEDFEVVVVDDGSTDRTRSMLEKMADSDRRFKVLLRSHEGILSALNAGLKECQADYIARMDSDDRSHPTRLEKQLKFMQENPDIAVTGCLVRGFPKEQVREGFRIYLEWVNSLISDKEIRREIFIESPFAHPSVIFKKSWVEEVGNYQEHGWAEDYDLWLRLYLHGAKFGKVPEVLLDWREIPGRLTRTDRRYSLENFIRAKAHYLIRGPLKDRDAVFVWGAGMMGRRLSKQLERQGCQLAAFIDIDPKKIGKTRRGKPIIAPDELEVWWGRFTHPALLSAVGARGARQLIRQGVNEIGLREGQDWWSAA